MESNQHEAQIEDIQQIQENNNGEIYVIDDLSENEINFNIYENETLNDLEENIDFHTEDYYYGSYDNQKYPAMNLDVNSQ